MFDDPLPLNLVFDWPVCVSQAEASAYCRWIGARLPTESEWNACRKFCLQKKPNITCGVNSDLLFWHSTPVGYWDNGDSTINDMVGNGWQWTSTIFKGLDGFTAYIKTYPGYSADFFDGKHFVLKGGSWATTRNLLRPSFRNWYQAHYPYVFSTFRPVK